MTRHRLLGAFILFVTATAAAAPIAYLLGLAQGARGAPYAAELDPAAFVDMTDAIWDCEQFGDYPGLRTIDIAIGCGPGMGRFSAARYRPGRLLGGPLQRALLTSIAGKTYDPPPSFRIPAPPGPASHLSLALAPQGGGLGSPTINGGVLPFVLPSGPLLPNIQPPPPAVPLFGAAPFMITGLAGLIAAGRSKRRRAA